MSRVGNGVARCYRKREWEVVHLPPEAARGLEVARDRTRSLVHDLSGQPIEDMLVAAYLQGVADGDQVARYENARLAS